MADSREHANAPDKILIVENDPTVSDLIGRQVLQSVGYQVETAADAATAINKALQWGPDLILADINLPGLSGKDLLVALASQGVDTPLIILAQRGKEADLIQTFRLGAADFLMLPAREAEVINAVARALQMVRDRRDRDRLERQLQQANNELQSRVRELTTIFALGKAMTSITDQPVLFEKILEGSVRITRAELGWFLLRDDVQKPFFVAAAHKLPAAAGARVGQPWDDGISSLVALSGEPLAIHGEPLRRFNKISAIGKAALIVPIQVRKKVIGLLVMLRQQDKPFGASEQHLLGALADYASIALVNARLFRDVETRARLQQNRIESAQLSDKVKDEILRQIKKGIANPLRQAQAALDGLSRDPLARWRPDQRNRLRIAQDALLHARETIDAVNPDLLPQAMPERSPVNLIELTRASLQRIEPYAQRGGVQVTLDPPISKIQVTADKRIIGLVLDAALSHAVKMTEAGGQVVARIEKSPENQAQISFHSGGQPLEPHQIEQLFSGKETFDTRASSPESPHSALAVSLHTVKEMLLRYNGKVWIDSPSRNGNRLCLCLPISI